jgi:hypothetical protein
MGDGGRPSAAALQEEAANHHEVRRSRAGVLNVVEKARQRARQVGAGKASESEPLRTCRKLQDDTRTGVEAVPRDELGGDLRGCPGGVRHKGGASPVQAPMWNVRTCRSAVRTSACGTGDRQAVATARRRVPMRITGADRPI